MQEGAPALQLSEDQFQAVLNQLGEWDISFDARASKSRALTFTSFVASPKMDCLQHEWQKPGSVRTILEVKGNDHFHNLQENSLQFWAEIQQLKDGKAVDIIVGGREVTVRLDLKLPADMSAHWEVFHCMDARAFVRSDSKVCHRCECTYGQLGVVFDMHIVQPNDTPDSIAERYGITVKELEDINSLVDNHEAKLAMLHNEKPDSGAAKEAAKDVERIDNPQTMFTELKQVSISVFKANHKVSSFALLHETDNDQVLHCR